MSKKQTTIKHRKAIEVRVLVPYALVTIFTALVIGLIAGYFSGIQLHGDARQAVMQDITASQVVLKDTEQTK